MERSTAEPVAAVAVGILGEAERARDLVAAMPLAGTVEVFIGTTSAGETAVGAQAHAVALGDLDRDGRDDAVVLGDSPDGVSTFRGLVFGQLSFVTAAPAGTDPRAVALGDLDRDGQLDAAVANAGSGDVTILLGRGDGGLDAGTSISVGVQPSAVALGDVDRDGRLDLAVANRGSGTVSVVFGDGDGGAASVTTVPLGVEPVAVALGDLDRDGRLDLVTGDRTSGPGGAVIVRLGRAVGFDVSRTGVVLPSAPTALTLGDVDRDGRLDVAVTTVLHGVVVAPGDGAGGFASPAFVAPVAAPATPTSIAVIDLGDNRLELAFGLDGGVPSAGGGVRYIRFAAPRAREPGGR